VANPRREAAEEVQLEILKLLVALAWLEGRRWRRIRRRPAAALGFTVSVDGWRWRARLEDAGRLGHAGEVAVQLK
jgi:hypothetical protein